MKYDIVSMPNLADLVEAVNRRCDLGWKPHGSLVVLTLSSYDVHERDAPYLFIQPMVKEEVV